MNQYEPLVYRGAVAPASQAHPTGVIGTSRPLPAWSEVVVAVGVGLQGDAVVGCTHRMLAVRRCVRATCHVPQAPQVARTDHDGSHPHPTTGCFECPDEELVAETGADFAFFGGEEQLCVPTSPFRADGRPPQRFIAATLLSGDCRAVDNGAVALTFVNDSGADCLFSVEMRDRPELGTVEVAVPSVTSIAP